MVLVIPKCMESGFANGGLEWGKMRIFIIGQKSVKMARQAHHTEHKGPMGICFWSVCQLVIVLALWWHKCQENG